MNILLLTNHLNIGGLTTYTAGLAEGLLEKGHNVLIGSGGGNLTGRIRGVDYFDLGLRTKCEFGFKAWRAFYRAVQIVKQNAVDIIHAQTRVSAVVAAVTSRRTGIPYVTTAHGFYRPNIGRTLFPCWGKTVIAISKPVYQHLLNDFHLDEEKITLIYNGTDFTRFSSPVDDKVKKRFCEQYTIPGDIPVIGTVSRLSPVKGHEYLLEAFYRFLKKKKVFLLLVGDGPIEAELKEKIIKYGIQENVRLIPSNDTPEVPLSVIDVFVLPSLQEGLSLSILEAQAAGKPVIATNVGGISQIILNEKSGILVPPKDVDALVQAFDILLGNKEKLESIAEAGKKRVKEKFNIERMINEIEEVYKSSACNL